MRVAVTGATGNIGTSVVEALAGEPAVDHVVGIARRRPDWVQSSTSTLDVPSAGGPVLSYAAADIRSPDLGRHLQGAEVVVHLAWAFQPTHDPLKTWDVNVRGGIAAFEAAAACGAGALVYVSSVGAYSPGPDEHVDESWPTHSIPTAAYGREKAYLERYLDAFELRHPGMRVVRLRPCFAFKRASAAEQVRIFAGPLLPRMLLRPGRLRLLAVPAGLRFQAVHTGDVGDAVRRAVLGDARGAFNIATDDVIDGSGLGAILGARTVTVPAAAARAAVGAGWRTHLVPADHQLLKLLLGLPTLDSGRARRELGWRPSRTGHATLHEMLTGAADDAGGHTPPLHPGRWP